MRDKAEVLAEVTGKEENMLEFTDTQKKVLLFLLDKPHANPTQIGKVLHLDTFEVQKVFLDVDHLDLFDEETDLYTEKGLEVVKSFRNEIAKGDVVRLKESFRVRQHLEALYFDLAIVQRVYEKDGKPRIEVDRPLMNNGKDVDKPWLKSDYFFSLDAVELVAKGVLK